MEIAVYLGAAVGTAFLIAYTMKWQGATLYWGKALAPNNELLPRGMQDAITPPAQTSRNILTVIMPLVLFMVGFVFFRWHVPVLTLLCTFLGSGIVGVALPKSESLYFCDRIRAQLVKRLHRYRQAGDLERFDAMQEVLNDFDAMNTIRRS